MKIKNIILFLTFLIGFSGCLIYTNVSYEIEPKGKYNGIAKINFYDIKSDAVGNKEFEEDKNALFNFMWKSDEFLSQMKLEGKDITSRKLYLDGKKLNAEVIFNFDDIKSVEGILYQEGFYYLTLDLADSVLSTNGTLIYSDNYKRILWADTLKNLKFDMKTNVQIKKLRELAPFLSQYQK
jgi:hypothetical protein